MGFMMEVPAQGMAGKRTQAMEANMAILQDRVRVDGLLTAKAQFEAAMMTRTTE